MPTKTRPFAAAIGFARRMGAPIAQHQSPKRGFAWDGTTLAVRGMPVIHLFHDVAHWMICPPRRRHLPDYGLGQGPDSVDGVDSVLGDAYAIEEEGRASLLGIIYMVMLDMDVSDALVDQQWVWGDDGKLRGRIKPQFARALSWLTRRGFLKFPDFDDEKMAAFVATVDGVVCS